MPGAGQAMCPVAGVAGHDSLAQPAGDDGAALTLDDTGGTNGLQAGGALLPASAVRPHARAAAGLGEEGGDHGATRGQRQLAI